MVVVNRRCAVRDGWYSKTKRAASSVPGWNPCPVSCQTDSSTTPWCPLQTLVPVPAVRWPLPSTRLRLCWSDANRRRRLAGRGWRASGGVASFSAVNAEDRRGTLRILGCGCCQISVGNCWDSLGRCAGSVEVWRLSTVYQSRAGGGGVAGGACMRAPSHARRRASAALCALPPSSPRLISLYSIPRRSAGMDEEHQRGGYGIWVVLWPSPACAQHTAP